MCHDRGRSDKVRSESRGPDRGGLMSECSALEQLHTTAGQACVAGLCPDNHGRRQLWKGVANIEVPHIPGKGTYTT